MALLKRVIRYLQSNGAVGTFHRIGQVLGEQIFRTYDRRARRQDLTIAQAAAQRDHQPDGGMISILVPVYNPSPEALMELHDSILAQTYVHWECILYDAGSTANGVQEALESFSDPRIRVIHAEENAGISGNTNAAAALARGKFLAFCDHDDTLAPQALWMVAQEIAKHDPDMIYSDEDRISENGRWRMDPHYKPDFCPDTLRSANYICHLMVVRKALFEKLGGFRPAFDGSQDHDLALRILENTQRIRHIPQVLYHWRNVARSMSHQHLDQCLDAAARAVTEHMNRIGWPGVCRIQDNMLRLHYDVPATVSIRTIRFCGVDYASMNRTAAEAAEDMLLFLHESVGNLSEDSVRELLMYAQRDDVAAATPVLMNRRGHVIHAGFHISQNGVYNISSGSHPCLNRVNSRNVAAVSAACFMVRKDCFIPFESSWQDGLGMVDWCLRQRQRGRGCVVTPHAHAICTESKLMKSWTDMDAFRQAWPAVQDPCVASEPS